MLLCGAATGLPAHCGAPVRRAHDHPGGHILSEIGVTRVRFAYVPPAVSSARVRDTEQSQTPTSVESVSGFTGNWNCYLQCYIYIAHRGHRRCETTVRHSGARYKSGRSQPACLFGSVLTGA